MKGWNFSWVKGISQMYQIFQAKLFPVKGEKSANDLIWLFDQLPWKCGKIWIFQVLTLIFTFLIVVLPSTILTRAGPVQNKGMCRRTMSSISAHVGCSWKRRGGLHNHALPLEPGLFDTCPVPQQCSHPTTDIASYFTFLKGHTCSV